jgi:aldose 1-epimerase
MQVDVLDYGAIVQSLFVPDRAGTLVDVVLGYEDASGYERDRLYLGPVIGRYANRIRGASFMLDGKRFRLSTNDGPNHLHGGVRGFGKVMWRARTFEDADAVGLVLTHRSHDGDEGYPGNLDVEVTYCVSSSNSFTVAFRARSDRPTPVNMTQHSYFNLSGEGSGDVLAHELMIPADCYTQIDASLLPTGLIAPVDGSPLDFRTPQLIGARIHAAHEQMRIAGGYDHTFVLSHAPGECALAARVSDLTSGVVMEVFTTEPGMQLYSGNFRAPIHPGKHGHRYDRHGGLCLETQHFPDSPNQPAFPSTVLRPGEDLRSRTEFRFSASA